MTVMKNITNRMLNEDMVLIYDKYFNQEEINDFISFTKPRQVINGLNQHLK